MKTKMKLIFPAAIAAMIFGAVSGQAAANPAPATTAPAIADTNAPATMASLFGDPVIAKGNGFEIKQSELDEVVLGIKSAAAAHGETVPPEQMMGIESQMLNRLIQIQILLQKSTDADKAEGKSKAELQISNLLDRAGSQEAFERQLKSVGMTSDELRSKVTQEATATATLTRELGINVTDADVKKFYADTNNTTDFEQPEMVRAAHILLSIHDPVTGAELTDDQKAAKKKQLEDILMRARGGEDFAALAKQYSEDPGSKDTGGEYTFPRGQMAPEFEAAAFSLTNNQISDIITTQFGYHIIKLLQKMPAKTMALTDKMPGTDMTVADKVKDFLTQQQTQKLAPAYLDNLKKNADVEILDPDLKAAAMAAATNAPSAMP
jgi:peptidyl-prolyl cis-trans isomerase C